MPSVVAFLFLITVSRRANLVTLTFENLTLSLSLCLPFPLLFIGDEGVLKRRRRYEEGEKSYGNVETSSQFEGQADNAAMISKRTECHPNSSRNNRECKFVCLRVHWLSVLRNGL